MHNLREGNSQLRNCFIFLTFCASCPIGALLTLELFRNKTILLRLDEHHSRNVRLIRARYSWPIEYIILSYAVFFYIWRNISVASFWYLLSAVYNMHRVTRWRWHHKPAQCLCRPKQQSMFRWWFVRITADEKSKNHFKQKARLGRTHVQDSFCYWSGTLYA